MATQDGRAKLADVGMAKLEVMGGRGDGKFKRASLDFPGGTFAWAAPEMLLGQDLTDALDVYSLGVVLWEIVTHVRNHGQEALRSGCRV